MDIRFLSTNPKLADLHEKGLLVDIVPYRCSNLILTLRKEKASNPYYFLKESIGFRDW